jgi:L-lactate dehydrogenase complex protein LldF
MYLTLPKVLISIAGIEKVIPRFKDLEVFLQTLPRSATGERTNPYNSTWAGMNADGPEEFHVILLDNARTAILADEESRQTLKCIRCGACQNACPVYRQTGGPCLRLRLRRPIGAILSPQLQLLKEDNSLPYASSLCGACYEVCPVKIDIPEVLIDLHGKIVRQEQDTLSGTFGAWNLGMQAAVLAFVNGDRLALAQLLGRIGQKREQVLHAIRQRLRGGKQSDFEVQPDESLKALAMNYKRAGLLKTMDCLTLFQTRVKK